jgi:nitrogen regulation protein NR(I)
LHRILIVDDEESIRWIISETLDDEDYQVLTAETGEEAMSIIESKRPKVVLLDIKLPGIDGFTLLGSLKKDYPDILVIMITAHGTVQTAIDAMKVGAYDYLTKPFGTKELKDIVRGAVETWEANNGDNFLINTHCNHHDTTLIGKSNLMQQIYKTIGKVADSHANVLILGENGTGKELVARSIHNNSSRNNGPFVTINCGAIPSELIESELFGHEKGSFTGAIAQKPGKFEMANGGTLFLDEIGELPLNMQVKLLRVLQEREIERVGGKNPIKIDTRILAATNRDLETMVEEGKFRKDLFYRLNVVSINLPPLRERSEDIPLLVEHFLNKYCSLENKGINSINGDAMARLMNYFWPGNIRELENTIERAVLLTPGNIILPDHLPEYLRYETTTKQDREKSHDFKTMPDIVDRAVEQIEKDLIIKTLVENNGNRTKAADVLGVSRRTLLLKLKKYDIE